MVILILLAALLFTLTVGPCLIALLIVGYREQVGRIAESANRNAGYWAEEAAKRYDAELENARLRGSLDTSQNCYAQMSRIAHEAIRSAEVKADVPERLRMIDDDSILNEDTIG